MRSGATVAIVAVSYKTDSAALAFAEQVSGRLRTPGSRLVIVQNAANDDRLGRSLGSTVPEAVCARSPENLGYFGGAQFGLEVLLGAGELPDWVVVSNVDVAFADGFLDALGGCEPEPDVGVLAPAMVCTRTGRNLNPFMDRRPPARLMRFYRIAFRKRWSLMTYEAAARTAGVVGAATRQVTGLHRRHGGGRARYPIYAPHGSCIVFSRRYFEAGGTLRYPCFLFNEEIHVAETCRNLHLRILYEPALRARHEGGISARHVRADLAGHVAAAAAWAAEQFADAPGPISGDSRPVTASIAARPGGMSRG